MKQTTAMEDNMAMVQAENSELRKRLADFQKQVETLTILREQDAARITENERQIGALQTRLAVVESQETTTYTILERKTELCGAEPEGEGALCARQMAFAFTSKLARLIAPDRFEGVQHELSRRGVSLKHLAKLLPKRPEAVRRLALLDLTINGLHWTDKGVTLAMRGIIACGPGSFPDALTEEEIARVILQKMNPSKKAFSAQLLPLLKILVRELGTGEGLLVR